MDEQNNDLSQSLDNTSAEDESKSAISADLIRGHINTIILRTLYERDKYGYEIIEEIERKSHGQYSLKQPTLYSALKRLESQGYINAYWKTDEVSLGGRRKYYTLTESGREITEKNQAEWEYSRTVIDNLISDRSFDFSQPAPTSVDFKILKKSTSRVPVIKDGEDEEEFDEEKEKFLETKESLPEVKIVPETVTYTEQKIYYEDPSIVPANNSNIQPSPAGETNDEVSKQTETVETYTNTTIQSEEEQRRIVHENYMRLISEPVQEPKPEEPDIVPVSKSIETEKLIYNNKPEPERNYKNLINSLFVRTVNPAPQRESEVIEQDTPVVTNTIRIDDLSVKAANDGLTVSTSEYVVSTRKKGYSLGGALFKSSLIVGIILLLEFMFSLIFKNQLGVEGVSLAYPFVIFAINVAQLLVFGVIYYFTDIGKISRKPTSTLYLSASIILSVILLLIIFIVSILLGVNFSNAGDVFAKIIIPCLVALNIPAFAGFFYAFSKN